MARRVVSAGDVCGNESAAARRGAAALFFVGGGLCRWWHSLGWRFRRVEVSQVSVFVVC